jgi:hypothetical protein
MHVADLLVSMPLAYMGLGSGLELVPYFLALLGFVAAASLAVVQWPLFALLRWWRKDKQRCGETPEPQSRSEGRESD